LKNREKELERIDMLKEMNIRVNLSKNKVNSSFVFINNRNPFKKLNSGGN
jgi:hypothetical protein